MRTPWLLSMILCLPACGARPPAKPKAEAPSATVEMDPMILEASKDGQKTSIVAYDAQSLFEAAKTAFEARTYQECADRYQRVLNRFPKSHYAHAALYNRGVCLEELRLHREAASHFRRYSQLATTERDRLDGDFRRGFNLIESGNYPEALQLYKSLLARNEIKGFDRAECLIRQAIARSAAGNFGQAEADLKAALSLINAESEGLIIGNDLAAEAYFRRGEIYYALNRKVPLKLPLAQMRADLKAKVRFFKHAQKSFLNALNVREPYWATAAGMKLGELYEQFYRDVLSAEIPKSMGGEERTVYFSELRKQLLPLLKQSVSIYERNITMGLRIGASNRWVRETEQRLKRLRSLIEGAGESDATTPADKEQKQSTTNG
ncbi:MAG: tetratricopeptide repeat protein [Myxococcota bacterium]|nr:tetratricopeptide repeat protein [Myxococcota bacterium]